MNKRIATLVLVGWALLLPPVFTAAQQRPVKDSTRREESTDYFKKWLDQDVVYIISEEELSVFQKLSTDVEREQFVEQFWQRRDPNPRTPENEFKEEHYRRIAYANDHFTAGIPGWLTDRGKIYIIHGPPDELESHPTGGRYDRPFEEGGGSTTTYPYERWWYRHIEGLGALSMEFVDRDGSGDYALAVSGDDKDAIGLMFGPGLNERADLGLPSQSSAFSHASTDPALRNPFSRYQIYAKVQAPAPIKYADLRQFVNVNLSFTPLQVRLEPEYFRLDQDQVLTPVTLQIENRDLTFKTEAETAVARLAIYGVVSSLSNQIVTEFEDEVTTAYRVQDLERGRAARSSYQRMLYLPNRSRYKLDLVVKDLEGGGVGVVQRVLVPPAFEREGLSSSSLVLSNYIQPLAQIPQNQMFVLGDMKVRPSLDRSFPQDGRMGIYLQLYGAKFDQATGKPSLKVTFRVLRDGRPVREVVETKNQSLQYVSEDRIVLIHPLDLAELEPGDYQLAVEVEDAVRESSLRLDETFRIAPFPQSAANR